MKGRHKVIVTVVFYAEDLNQEQYETILFWAKDEIEIGKILYAEYKDDIISYEAKWLNEGPLVIPSDIFEEIVQANSY